MAVARKYVPVDTDFIRKVWLPALRSGEYRQGRTELRTKDDKFCCLGVACDVLLFSGRLPEEEHWMWSESGTFTNGLGQGSDALLPYWVSQKIGIPASGSFDLAADGARGFWIASEIMDNLQPQTKELIRDDRVHSLIDLNDEGAPFEDIATIIEASIDGKASPFRPVLGDRSL